MAKRKKHHASGHKRKHSAKKSGGRRRRRRMGAVSTMLNPSSTLVKIGVPVVGYLLSDQINGMIDKVNGGKLDNKIVAGAQGIGGALLVFKKRPGLVTTIIGGLLLGSGVKRGLTAFGVITGFRSVPVIDGFRKVPVIGNYAPNGGMNGYNVPGKKSAIVGSFADGLGDGKSDRR